MVSTRSSSHIDSGSASQDQALNQSSESTINTSHTEDSPGTARADPIPATSEPWSDQVKMLLELNSSMQNQMNQLAAKMNLLMSAPGLLGNLSSEQASPQTNYQSRDSSVSNNQEPNLETRNFQETARQQEARAPTSASVFVQADSDAEDQEFKSCQEPNIGVQNIGRTKSNFDPTEYFPEHSGHVAATNPFPIHQVEPPRFSGDRMKALSWLRDYEDCMNINGYNDAQKLQRARAYLDSEAREWYNTKLRLVREIDWYTLKSSFQTTFCGIESNQLFQRKLSEGRMRPGELPRTYFNRVINICTEFNPEMQAHQLAEKVVSGLDTATYNMLAAQEDPSSWTLEWLGKRLERFRPEHPSREGQDKIQNPRRRASGNDQAKGTPQIKDLSTWMCFNCNELGHDKAVCPLPRNEEKLKANSYKFREEKRRKQAQNGDQNTSRRVEHIAANTPNLACDAVPKLTLCVNINGSSLLGRVDTGADITVLPGHVAKRLELKLTPWQEPKLKAAGNGTLEVEGMTAVMASIDGRVRALLVVVVSKQEQPLWGLDLMDAFQLKLDFAHGSREPPVAVVATNDRVISSIDSQDRHPTDQVTFGNLSADDRGLFEQFLIQFGDVFSRDEQDIGHTSTIKHRINLIDETPVFKMPYRIPIRLRDEMKQTLDRLEATGAIRKSKSPYASPVFFVPKDNGLGKRLVADYRELNKKTVADRMPMPHPEDVFGLLHNTRVYAKLDITSMFNQIQIDERDIEKTAITTVFGLYECPLMPFGLQNAPATAVRLMREVLRDLDSNTCYVYFDDIIIFAADTRQLMQRCIQVLDRLREHGLKLKPAKCSFGVESVKFLGHIITSQGIQIDPTRIQNVANFPTPRNPTDVRSFHGLCNYNRKFIKNFSAIAKPLTPLMGKPADFTWTAEANAAFEELRSSLMKTPVLKHFDPDADHELRTDASNYATGAVLYQRHADPQQTGVVLYHSKTLNAAQRNYSTTERELLAAFIAITELQHYLFGKRFTLVTDHHALCLLHNEKDPHQRHARWVAKLQSYDFQVVYKRGVEHLDADCMSRLVEDADFNNEEHVPPEQFIRTICHVTTGGEEPSSAEQVVDLRTVDIRTEQRQDQFCKKYIEILESDSLTESEKSTQAPNFSMQDGLLYRVKDGHRFLLVVPARRRNAVLLSCHDVPLAGHLGFQRTLTTINGRFYWPKMRVQIKRYVASCLNCQRRKIRNTRKEGFIQPLPIAEDVFDTVGIDLITRLPKSKTGCTSILVCTDNLSKYAITVALADMEAETIIAALYNHVITKYGCPKVVLSDNGSNLIGGRSEDFFRLLGIKRVHTTPYHPQTNGQTERFNRTLKTSLTMFVNEKVANEIAEDESQRRNPHSNWTDFLQAVTFAYNISEHSVTRVTPFEMVFNRQPRLPIDNQLDRNDFVDPLNPVVGSRSSEQTKLIKELILKNQLANKRRLDARLKQSTFKEGDMVLVERPTHVRGQASKLQFSYLGPYKIHRKVNDLTYEIAFLRNRPGLHKVHVSTLRHLTERFEEVTDEIVDPTFIPPERVANPTQQRPSRNVNHVIDEDQSAAEALASLGNEVLAEQAHVSNDGDQPQDAPIVIDAPFDGHDGFDDAETLSNVEPNLVEDLHQIQGDDNESDEDIPSPEYEELTPPRLEIVN